MLGGLRTGDVVGLRAAQFSEIASYLETYISGWSFPLLVGWQEEQGLTVWSYRRCSSLNKHKVTISRFIVRRQDHPNVQRISPIAFYSARNYIMAVASTRCPGSRTGFLLGFLIEIHYINNKNLIHRFKFKTKKGSEFYNSTQAIKRDTVQVRYGFKSLRSKKLILRYSIILTN